MKDYDVKYETTDFGWIRKYNFENSSLCLYAYNDDPYSIFLSNLEVNHNFRNKGIGNYMINVVVNHLAPNLGRTKLYLCVDEKSWMFDWYKRKGFKFVGKNYERDGYVWVVIRIPHNPV